MKEVLPGEIKCPFSECLCEWICKKWICSHNGPFCCQQTHNLLMQTSKNHPDLLLWGSYSSQMCTRQDVNLLISKLIPNEVRRLQKSLWVSPAPTNTQCNALKMRWVDCLVYHLALSDAFKAPPLPLWSYSVFHWQDCWEQMILDVSSNALNHLFFSVF